MDIKLSEAQTVRLREEFYLGILIAAGAMIQDLKYRKIKNRYLLICLAAVVIYRAGLPVASPAVQASANDLKIELLRRLTDALAGGFLPVLLLGWLFWFRMMGAGDLKLLIVLGFLFGADKSMLCIWRTMLFGAVMSVGIMAANGSGYERMQHLVSYVRTYLSTGNREPYRRPESWDKSANLHMTVPVLMAVLSLGI